MTMKMRLILSVVINAVITHGIVCQNIGIDIPNPGEKLVVNGNIMTPTGNSVYVGGRTDLGNAGSRFHNSNGHTYLDNKGTGHIYFRNDNALGATERMVIQQNGRVGIGNMNPSEMLTVNGNVSLSGNIITESPITPTLQNGWGEGNTGGQRAPRYMKDKQGFVHLWGGVFHESGSSNSVIFTLPVGYRPMGGNILLNQPGGGTNGMVRIEIRPNGEVRIVGNSITWVSLDNIQFMP